MSIKTIITEITDKSRIDVAVHLLRMAKDTIDGLRKEKTEINKELVTKIAKL